MSIDIKPAPAISIVLAALLLCPAGPHAARSVRQAQGRPAGEVASATAQGKPSPPDPWYARTKGSFQTVRAPDQRFQFECPTRDWTVLGGGGPVSVIAVGKKGEVFVVERAVLNRALDQADIGDLFVQLETETIKERLPSASEFRPRIIEAPDRRIVAIEFNRPAANNTPERARQYSIAVGTELYRLTCASPVPAFPAYGATCAHMVASFTVAGVKPR